MRSALPWRTTEPFTEDVHRLVGKSPRIVDLLPRLSQQHLDAMGRQILIVADNPPSESRYQTWHDIYWRLVRVNAEASLEAAKLTGGWKGSRHLDKMIGAAPDPFAQAPLVDIAPAIPSPSETFDRHVLMAMEHHYDNAADGVRLGHELSYAAPGFEVGMSAVELSSHLQSGERTVRGRAA